MNTIKITGFGTAPYDIFELKFFHFFLPDCYLKEKRITYGKMNFGKKGMIPDILYSMCTQI
jgi:hypothetical protein